jgi:hypothetical protein
MSPGSLDTSRCLAAGSIIEMIPRLHKSGRTTTRAIAIFGAALLLLVSQTIGVAHFHEGTVPRDGIVAPQAGTDPGLCPVCQLALHSPGSVTAATTVARGAVMAETIFIAAPTRLESPVFSIARVRAPPVSL